MDRFKELKDKGWRNLSISEREEYQALKPDVTESQPEENKITLSKEELAALMDEKINSLRKENLELKTQNQGLEKQIGIGDWAEVEKGKDRTYTATFKMWRPTTDDKWSLVVDWKHLRFDYDEGTRKYDKDIYKVRLLNDNGDYEDVEMTLSVLSNINDTERVEIVGREDKPLSMSQGKVRKSTVTRGGATMSVNYKEPGIDVPEGGEWVDLSVHRTDTIFTMKRKSGQKFKAKGDRLNA
jgi:hypothetical protein|tara:strand:+ start:6810 stop:7529 length:720 start_codon:yes stop_codon:yes gene_type:complete